MGLLERKNESASRRNRSPGRRYGLVAGLALTAALVVGVLAVTGPAGAQSEAGDSDTTGDAATTGTEVGSGIEERLNDVLAPLITDGTLTEDQRDAVVETLLAARGSGHLDGRYGGHHGRGPGGGRWLASAADLAELLGLSTEELRTGLRGGDTLADLAADSGVEVSAVVDLLLGSATDRVDAAIDSGRLDAGERENCLAALEVGITARVNGEQVDGSADRSACGDRGADGRRGLADGRGPAHSVSG